MFDLSMFPTVTRVTRKTTADLKVNPFKNNVVTRVTRKNACGLQENINENNIVTRVTHVTRKNNNVRNNIDAEHEAFEERAAIAEAPPRAAHVAAFCACWVVSKLTIYDTFKGRLLQGVKCGFKVHHYCVISCVKILCLLF